MSLSRREKVIYSLVTVSGITSVDTIAEHLGIGYKKTVKLIEAMITRSNGFAFVNETILFKRAQIDYKNRKIVLDPNSASIPASMIENIGNFFKPQPQKAEKMAVVCNSCGAKDEFVAGTVATCQFCGSPITANK